jgi:hypothetical protein
MKFYEQQCFYNVNVIICFTRTHKWLRMRMKIYILLFWIKFIMDRMGASQLIKENELYSCLPYQVWWKCIK